MTLRFPNRTLAALFGAAALAYGLATPVRAQAPASPDSAIVTVSPETLGPDAVRLARAVAERRAGNRRGVIENLEAIDFSADTLFSEADRAAFLLGQAYLEIGALDRFERLAAIVSRWTPRAVYARWLEYQRNAIAGGAAGDTAGAARLSGSPLAPYVAGLDLSGATDGDAELAALAAADTTTRAGRDLAALARLEQASRILEAGGDPRALLESVPAGSAGASRARHMLGLLALERGETDAGRALLESVLADDSTYAGRRDVLLALSGTALERGEWTSAYEGYARAERDWEARRVELDRLAAGGDFAALWSAWESGPAPGALRLDGAPARTLAERLAAESENLSQRPAIEVPKLDEPADSIRAPLAPPPPPEALRDLARVSRAAGEAGFELERARWALADERAGLEDRRRYLGFGLARTRSESAQLAEQSALLDSIRATLERLDRRLRDLRDGASRRVLVRTQQLLAKCADDLLWMSGLEHFHVNGPDRARAIAAPPGWTGPDSVLIAEQSLAREIESVARRMAAETPGVIQRSYDLAWRPNVIDRANRQGEEAYRSLAFSRRLAARLDSTLAAAGTSSRQRALEREVAARERTSDSLAAGRDARRERYAREAVARARAELDPEREAIAYGLAVSAYGLGVGLERPDSAATPGATPSRAVVTNAAPDAAGDEPDDPERARWREQAIPRLRGFLDTYPQSLARAEIRFRLADLLLTDARHRFQREMAAYLKAQEAGADAGRLPVLSHGDALALYRAILAEDPDFPQRDAVQFNAAMILADEGDAGAAALFEQLVTEHPQSPYVQESYLRLGDLQFDERRFLESTALYERAAAGPDPSLRAIALYKMGWAHFNEDRFAAAADAFRSVLDLFASERGIEIQADIEGEAETYFLHSLAGAGGPEDAAAYFDRIGPRPYEKRMLMALGQHYRRFGELPNAAATDAVCLRRFPLDPDALLSLQRLVETLERAERPDSARAARLAYAPAFAPRGAWHEAQTGDSLREAGAEFARSSWRLVAQFHHARARDKGTADDWRQALRLYETLISYWPADSLAPAFHLYAGEASFRLGGYPGALEHYGAAARTGADSLAAVAMWQRVAVFDAWYESTRAGRTGAATGSDSLARAVLGAADELLARFPEHEKGSDLVWRQSQLAFAHGWYPRAVDDFARMMARYPDDSRSVLAASLRGEAYYRLGDYDSAGGAFEQALLAAQKAHVDSLERRASEAIPVCWFRAAEAAVAADSTDFVRHAERFERIAARWPRYELAHVAQYRAGLAYLKAGRTRQAVTAMEALIQNFPRSEYVKDAHLEVAKSLEAAGERENAAAAYVRFADRYPDDESAGPAYLKAADLLAEAGLTQKATDLRLAYIRQNPDDVETAMEILEALARKEIEQVGPELTISQLLPAPKKGVKNPAPVSRLGEYLQHAAAHPELASRDLLAHVRFLQAEESMTAYSKAALTLPLPRSIAAKQKLLDSTLVRYRRTVDLGVPEWAHASACRIGEALAGFGESLERSERPADLSEEDRLGYEDVLFEQAQAFYERAEGVWTDLLRQKLEKSGDDPWVARAQSALWKRLGDRFYCRPEVEYPSVAADVPARHRVEKKQREKAPVSARHSGRAASPVAKKEGAAR